MFTIYTRYVLNSSTMSGLGIVELYSSHNMVEQAHLRSVFPLW